MARDTRTLRKHSQTRAHEVHTYRRRALWDGLRRGAITWGATLVVAILLLLRLDARWHAETFWLLTIGGTAPVFVAIGAMRWRRAHIDDAAHHRFQKAPSLLLRLAHDHDRAWVEGEVRCPQPLRPRELAKVCSWYHLVIEEQRGSGKNSHWTKVHESERATSIWLTEGDREIEVDLRRATIDYPAVLTRRRGNQRLTLRYLEAQGTASACGVVRRRVEVLGEHKAAARDAALAAWLDKHKASQEAEEARAQHMDERQRLRAAGQAIRARKRQRERGPLRPRPHSAWHLASLDEARGVPAEARLMLASDRGLPLLVTPLNRPHWHDRSEADELKDRAEADVLLGLGIPALVWGLGVWVAWWPFAPLPGALVGVVVMLAALLPSRLVRLYNRFALYRQRVGQAHGDLQVELQLRRDLLPQLAAVVRAAAAHERALQARLAALREHEDATATIHALRERHPDLASAAGFADLADGVIAVEEKLAFCRAHLRDAITEYNTTIERFPEVLLAWPTGHRALPLPQA